MIEQTHDEWVASAVRLYGKDPRKWRFMCPACGTVATPEQHIGLGGDLQDGPVVCIKRTHKLAVDNDVRADCDWTAYGLLGTLGRGRVVRNPDGRSDEVFDFADPVPSA